MIVGGGLVTIEKTFDPAVDQVRVARRFVADHAPPALADDAALVASELVTNAIEHASSPVTVRVELRGEALRVEVSDSSAILPAVADLLTDSERGRGLHLVEGLTAAWGVESSESGKTVWFEMAAPSSSEG
jgi:anti-sigma regulatory factor (Ser/Thr protein kinase)